MSKLSFNLLNNKYDDIEIALKLGERSYLSKHVLLKSPNLKEVKL
ncbi:MAG: hypothetical protein KBA67_06935 [Leptotrichiaceae bacterium]|nr:hypothetical protein [Leptotrichiaceae bacterium]MBP9630607.1 hypothetical protein [Leptotrichiaceae bacterium]